MQILPGIYLANGFPYQQHQNSYLVVGEGAAVLVDSGDLEERETFDLVRENLALWGLRPEDVTHLLVTHAHFDHSSHAAAWQRLGAQVVASQAAADAMATGDDRCIGYAVRRTFEPCRVDRVLRDGETLPAGNLAFRAIAAPGHADSCLIYELQLDGRRVWFGGDVILTDLEGWRVELGWNGGPDYHRPTYLETLRRLAHLPCDVLLPGHGAPRIGEAWRQVQMAYTKALMEWR